MGDDMNKSGTVGSLMAQVELDLRSYKKQSYITFYDINIILGMLRPHFEALMKKCDNALELSYTLRQGAEAELAALKEAQDATDEPNGKVGKQVVLPIRNSGNDNIDSVDAIMAQLDVELHNNDCRPLGNHQRHAVRKIIEQLVKKCDEYKHYADECAIDLWHKAKSAEAELAVEKDAHNTTLFERSKMRKELQAQRDLNAKMRKGLIDISDEASKPSVMKDVFDHKPLIEREKRAEAERDSAWEDLERVEADLNAQRDLNALQENCVDVLRDRHIWGESYEEFLCKDNARFEALAQLDAGAQEDE